MKRELRFEEVQIIGRKIPNLRWKPGEVLQLEEMQAGNSQLGSFMRTAELTRSL